MKATYTSTTIRRFSWLISIKGTAWRIGNLIWAGVTMERHRYDRTLITSTIEIDKSVRDLEALCAKNNKWINQVDVSSLLRLTFHFSLIISRLYGRFQRCKCNKPVISVTSRFCRRVQKANHTSDLEKNGSKNLHSKKSERRILLVVSILDPSIECWKVPNQKWGTAGKARRRAKRC
jgi:hypothetical protein